MLFEFILAAVMADCDTVDDAVEVVMEFSNFSSWSCDTAGCEMGSEMGCVIPFDE